MSRSHLRKCSLALIQNRARVFLPFHTQYDVLWACHRGRAILKEAGDQFLSPFSVTQVGSPDPPPPRLGRSFLIDKHG